MHAPWIKQLLAGSGCKARVLSSGLWDDPEGWGGKEGGSRERDIHARVAESCGWTTETNATLQSNPSPIKINNMYIK